MLKELNNSLDASEWTFCRNVPQDIPQQQNGFDCGVYVLLYARCLVLRTAIIMGNQNILQNVKKYSGVIHGFEEADFEIEKYYTVEYQKSFYFVNALLGTRRQLCY